MKEPELSTFEVVVNLVVAVKLTLAVVVLFALATHEDQLAARHPADVIIEQPVSPPAPVTRPRYVKTMYA